MGTASVAGHVTAGDFVAGDGFSKKHAGCSRAKYYLVRAYGTDCTEGSYDLATALAGDNYIAFEVQAAEGKQLNLTQLSFEYGYSTQGEARKLSAYRLSSVDGFDDTANFLQ